MKRYRVRISDDAEADIFDIYRFIATEDSVERADYVLEELETLCSSLATSPSRGHVPPELERIGVTNFREVHFKPCSYPDPESAATGSSSHTLSQ